MNTDVIREYVEGTPNWKRLVLAVQEIAAALDVLDERTRGAITIDTVSADSDLANAFPFPAHEEIIASAQHTSAALGLEGEPEPGPDTCDCGRCNEERLTGASTIPGCYCRECKYYREDDEVEGFGWCKCSHPDAHATRIASREYGCVFGERREAE